MGDKPKNLSDIDNFWDLNSLLPKKRPVFAAPRQVNTETVELSVGSDDVSADHGVAVPPRGSGAAYTSGRDTARRLNELPMRTRANEYRSRPLDPYLVYEPECGLIHRVEVSKWDSRFNFYENFSADIKRLWSRKATPAEHVSFFSYVPQYSQLKYAQLKWYLWWRDNLRRGVYLRTDFCYILLYIYEIINCGDLVSPVEGLELLCDVWLNYRSEHRRIDSYMCEWVCDYCLINRLKCPTERLEPILGDIVAVAGFKEFYMGSDVSGSAAAAILAYSSAYDWHKSRYVTSENVNLFSVHIKGAFEKAYREVLSEKDDGFSKEMRVERNAYDGALCAYDMKRTVTVEYASYSRSPKFRFAITDIIKYSENRIRMALGIKSRLKVEDLTDRLKNSIDEYFDVHLPAKKKSAQPKKAQPEAEIHEYDKLYEPASQSLSLENALKIESDSWSTTDILTSAFEEAEAVTVPEEPINVPVAECAEADRIYDSESDGGDEFAVLADALDEWEIKALAMLARGQHDGIAVIAARSGVFADALADRINETAFDIIGDSIVEAYGDGYRLISDYEGDIAKWLK